MAVAAVVSLIAALRLADTDLNRAYDGTDTRAYQLLAGAFLALIPQLLRLARRRERGPYGTYLWHWPVIIVMQ